jgi:hypothetical protein
MRRVISLFRDEQGYGAAAAGGERDDAGEGQPGYFLELLDYLRERREEAQREDEAARQAVKE